MRIWKYFYCICAIQVLYLLFIIIIKGIVDQNTVRDSEKRIIIELRQKDDGKPCMACMPSVKIILFEITFRRTPLSFKRIFLKRPENILKI